MYLCGTGKLVGAEVDPMALGFVIWLMLMHKQPFKVELN